MKLLSVSQFALPLYQMTVSPADETRIRQAYAGDGMTSTDSRISLELKYASLLTPTDEFNRKLVSYQANKQARLHSWLKYKEGFSAQLVEILLSKFGIAPGHRILDPFAGSATTLLVARELGIDVMAIEILPVCHLAWRAKSHYHQYDLAELHKVKRWLRDTLPGVSSLVFPHITITQSAFAPEQEDHLMWYAEQFSALQVSDLTKLLLRLVLVSILEDVSYTRKDGQYLRWDSRSSKVQQRQALSRADRSPTESRRRSTHRRSNRVACRLFSVVACFVLLSNSESAARLAA